MKHIKPSICFFICLFCFFNVFADTIVLKSGVTIEGKIVAENESSVKVDRGGVRLTYWKDDIKEITRATEPKVKVADTKAQTQVPGNDIKVPSIGTPATKEVIADFVKQLDTAGQSIEVIIVKAKADITASVGNAAGIENRPVSIAHWDIIQEAKMSIADQIKKTSSLHTPRGCGRLREYSMKIARTAYGEFEANSSDISSYGQLAQFWSKFETRLLDLKTQYNKERSRLLEENKIKSDY
jgi:hypothetical protein